MYLIVLVVLVLAVAASQYKIFFIYGPTSKIIVRSCASESPHPKLYTYYMGRLSNFHTNYEELKVTTEVSIEGDLQMMIDGKRLVAKKSLELTEFLEFPGYKQFERQWKIDFFHEWATYIAVTNITVKFLTNDDIYLNMDIRTKSLMTTACSEIIAFVKRIKVVV
ncbi:unnamed protein product [Arctia plantaginis]|uniref:Uncharacterized protein n=1 Tax=Arctia plantaginis TaxID=874455 RepID=A0A8S0YZD9_ARCPL|nr:unnamed protein product [Arctia plantaginis]